MYKVYLFPTPFETELTFFPNTNAYDFLTIAVFVSCVHFLYQIQKSSLSGRCWTSSTTSSEGRCTWRRGGPSDCWNSWRTRRLFSRRCWPPATSGRCATRRPRGPRSWRRWPRCSTSGWRCSISGSTWRPCSAVSTRLRWGALLFGWAPTSLAVLGGRVQLSAHG